MDSYKGNLVQYSLSESRHHVKLHSIYIENSLVESNHERPRYQKIVMIQSGLRYNYSNSFSDHFEKSDFSI